MDEIGIKKEMWSVELETSCWEDDTFNGTYDECVEYCEKYDNKIDEEEAQLAKILVEDNLVIEVLKIVDEL